MESLGIADVTMFVTEHERGYGDYTEERIKRFSIKTVDDIAFVLFCFSLFFCFPITFSISSIRKFCANTPSSSTLERIGLSRAFRS